MNQFPLVNSPLQTFRALLKSCISGRNLAAGAALHALYIKSFVPQSTYVSNHFVLLYSNCNSLSLALQQFDEIPHPNVFSYNALLNAHARLSASVDASTALFRQIPDPDLVSYNTLLSAFAAGGWSDNAVDLFNEMRRRDLDCDGFTLSSVISSLNGSGVEQFHGLATVSGLDVYVSVGNALMSSYSKMGMLMEAERVFEEKGDERRDEVSWNCMIVAYGQHREGSKALTLFQVLMEEMNFFSISLIFKG